MKTTTLLLVLAAAPLAAQLSQGERDYAMSQLHATRKMFLDSIAGLTPAQWKSVQGVAEHVVLGEDAMFDRVQRVLKTPASPGRKVDRSQDEEVYRKAAIDEPRTAHTGKWTPAALAQAFKQKRDRTIRYVESTRDPLREHVGEGGLDAYQALLLIAAHTERHMKELTPAMPGR